MARAPLVEERSITPVTRVLSRHYYTYGVGAVRSQLLSNVFTQTCGWFNCDRSGCLGMKVLGITTTNLLWV
ncbi:hypothetical protein M758_3G046700 [Ceratodon purpureus]|nr:hypothetical protein M758_3G046700 [Ceratodon purpureus]